MARMTDRFLEEIKHSHNFVSYVDVIAPDLRTVRLPATDGEVTVDNTAAVRRSCNITCVDPTGELTPRDPGGILTPYGSEIRPYRGVVYSDGTEEVAPLGVFRISKVDVSDAAGGSPEIKIEAYDRSRTIARDKFTVPYVVEEGTNLLTAIREIIDRTFPGATYDSITTTMTTSAPMLFDAGDNPWEAVTELALSMGCEIGFGVEGEIEISPPTDINALPAPDFSYIEGQGCTMTDLSLVFTDEPGFNGVIVAGESTGDELPPVRGEAWDEEPTSPTYRKGPYGEVPQFVTDTNVKTEEEAAIVAESILAGSLGFSAQLSVTATVNPALEAGNVVEVRRARTGVSGLYTLDAFKVPLSKSGTQPLTLRQKRAAVS